MNSEKLEVGGRISINNMRQRKAVCEYVQGVFGGAEKEFPMVCNRKEDIVGKGRCGADGTIQKKLEVMWNLKTILLLNSSKHSPILKVIPDLWNAFFKTLYILLPCL